MSDNGYINSSLLSTGGIGDIRETTVTGPAMASDLNNNVVSLPNEIRETVEFSIMNNDIDTSSPDVYVLVEAYSNNERIAYTSLPITDSAFTLNSSNINVNLLEVITQRLGLSNGIYDIKICVYENLIYSNADQLDLGKLQIEEISDTRFEIRTKASLPKYDTSFQAISELSNQGDQPNTVYPIILKDIGNNKSITSTNWTSIEYEDNNGNTSFQTIFRSIEPLSSVLRTGSRLHAIREIITPYVIPVTVDLESIITTQFNELRGPNFKAVDVKNKPAKSTVQETWNSLLGSDLQTSQNVVNNILSGSRDAELNIDYRKYENFVHFSSAAERLKNFKYKVELIEYYTSQSNFVSSQWIGKQFSTATASAEFSANKATYDTKKENIISGFDNYEQYLYFNSHSTEDTTYGYFPSATWPKTNNKKPYTLEHSTGSSAVSWYSSQLASASLYDETNINMLRNSIPLHILEDENSNSYVMFVDMIGQHFDLLYSYIDNMTTKTGVGESVFEGLSKDLVYEVASSFGWNLQPGFDSSKLWEYALGTNEQGQYNSGNSFVVEQSYSHGDIEKQVWKRILNNIPYFLKTKGTTRGIKALLSTYGIPSTILQVQEFGGPVLEEQLDIRREIEKFNYALDFSGSAYIKTEHRSIDYDKSTLSLTSTGSANRYPSMYEMRFDISHKKKMHLASSMTNNSDGNPNWQLTLEHSSSAAADSLYYNYGRLVFKVTYDSSNEVELTSEYLPFYDNDWWNVSFGATEHPDSHAVGSTNNFKLRYAKIADHSDVLTFSGSKSGASNANVNSAWRTAGTVKWGGVYSNGSGIFAFSGSMQEIRMWAEHIGDNAFYQHTLAPTSILGDSTEMAYNDLLMRIPLGTDGISFNHSSTTTTPNRAPNINNNTPFIGAQTLTPSYVSWPDINNYQGKSEVYYVNVPNPVGSRPHDKKIRIEDNSLTGNTLSHDISYETSSYNANAIDNDEVSIALSPQDQIDIDIAMQFGGLRLDDYIGDPRDQYSNSYKSLTNIRNLYFKKFDDKYNIWAFIRLLSFFNTGVFKQIEDMLPARADATVGLIIRPSILERVKVGSKASLSFENMHYTSSISVTPSLTNTMISSLSSTLNVGARPGNPSYNRFVHGMEYTYGGYTEAGVLEMARFDGVQPLYDDSTAFSNLIYDGCQITSPDFNEPSPGTIDGGPAVEYILTNPNILVTTETTPIQGSNVIAPNTDIIIR
tara:strand:- start:2903 stop:6553 length:3651 start_codon:yes stop_codon:yes gene_type:complete